MQHINLDIADVNNNGKPEIFVTCMLKGKIVTYVIEFRDNAYQRITEVPGFLRVVDHGRRGSILLGQAYDPVSFYSGRPKQYAWSGGTYVAGADFPLPKDMRLYGFTVAELGEAAPVLVGLDEKERLIVYSGSNMLIWRSEDKYPAVGLFVTKPETGIEAVLKSGTEYDKTRKARVNGRVVSMDLNGDGRDEIILPKNEGDLLLGGYEKADLIGLAWSGSRFEQRRSIQDVPGAVMDFQVIPRQGGGAQVLTLIKQVGGIFSRDRYGVMTYAVE
jgi:hypothetical protein